MKNNPLFLFMNNYVHIARFQYISIGNNHVLQYLDFQLVSMV